MKYATRVHRRSPLLGLALTAIPATAMFSAHGTIEGTVDGAAPADVQAAATNESADDSTDEAPAAGPATPEDQETSSDREPPTTAEEPASGDESATDAPEPAGQPETEAAAEQSNADEPTPGSEANASAPSSTSQASDRGVAESVVQVLDPVAPVVPVEQVVAEVDAAAAPVATSTEEVLQSAAEAVDVVVEVVEHAPTVQPESLVEDDAAGPSEGDLAPVAEAAEGPVPAESLTTVESEAVPVLPSPWERDVDRTFATLGDTDVEERDALRLAVVVAIEELLSDVDDLDRLAWDEIGRAVGRGEAAADRADLLDAIAWLDEPDTALGLRGCSLDGDDRLGTLRVALQDEVALAVAGVPGVEVVLVDDAQLVTALVLFDRTVDCEGMVVEVDETPDPATLPVTATPVVAPSSPVAVDTPAVDGFTALGGR